MAPSTLLSLLFLFPLACTQQIGSFFTAIQYNNGALPAGASSCNNMGGSASGYCCNSGHSCAWDDSGAVACCAQGATCSGSANGGNYAGGKYNQGQQQQQQQQWGAGAGAGGGGAGGGGGGGGAGAGCNTCQNVCNTCQQEHTTTVYQQQSWAPQSSWQPVSTYQPQTYVPVATSLPQTVTVAGAAVGGVQITTTVPANQACGGGGYTTLTQANVGAPVRTVGCYVIFDAGATRTREMMGWRWMGMGAFGWLGWWVGALL